MLCGWQKLDLIKGMCTGKINVFSQVSLKQLLRSCLKIEPHRHYRINNLDIGR